MQLYIVATPIGHWDDMTLRALETLRNVDIIACEDTRETKHLLDHFEITGKTLVSYHAQSPDSREDELLRTLEEGRSVALVSDRGTPGISDPGSRLIRRAIAAGVSIVPIPGASAIVTALQASGVDTSRFEFIGFLPHKKGRQTLLQYCKDAEHTVVFYESPHRILKALDALSDCAKPLVVGRELTKMHEEFLRGTASEILAELSSRPSVKGEFVVIVDVAPRS